MYSRILLLSSEADARCTLHATTVFRISLRKMQIAHTGSNRSLFTSGSIRSCMRVKFHVSCTFTDGDTRSGEQLHASFSAAAAALSASSLLIISSSASFILAHSSVGVSNISHHTMRINNPTPAIPPERMRKGINNFRIPLTSSTPKERRPREPPNAAAPPDPAAPGKPAASFKLFALTASLPRAPRPVSFKTILCQKLAEALGPCDGRLNSSISLW